MIRDKVQIYSDKAGEWRWRRVAANGRIVSESGEGYRNKAFCRQMARRLNVLTRIEEQP